MIITSTAVKVGNSDPSDVFFTFPTGPDSNVLEIQMVFNNDVGIGTLFVYESNPVGNNITYPFLGVITKDANIEYQNPGKINATMKGSLINPVTVETADHVVTVESAIWTAALTPGRHGYFWEATSGSAQISVS